MTAGRFLLISFLAGTALIDGTVTGAGEMPLLEKDDALAIADEISGEVAKRNLEFITRQHRIRGSRQFRAASEFILERLAEYGLEEAEILEFPADGVTMFGTQKSRPAWDADFAELWEVRRDNGAVVRVRRLASFEAMPVTLAQDSESGAVLAPLVDIGAGTSDSDYEGKDVSGKLVLTSSQPGRVAELAIGKYGAAGFVSYAQNQRTAWWGENENLVRWGHLTTFSEIKTFAFMVSLKEARSLKERLAAGEDILFDARVVAGQHPGIYSIVTAVIKGSDPSLKDEEIAFTCHLDHQRPGANDNASGCMAILEVARSMKKLIDEGVLERPRRSLRFIWPPEIEGSMIYLTGRPDLASRVKALIHMDMVGGGLQTKAIFHVSRTPDSLPSFVGDVGISIGRFVNVETYEFASGQSSEFPLNAPEGQKQALLAVLDHFSLGSDHQVFGDSSFGVPYIYLHDWPDRYIHTNFDTAAMVDPTKLKRSAFIGASSAWYLANLSEADVPGLLHEMRLNTLDRLRVMLARREQLGADEAANMTGQFLQREERRLASLMSFLAIGDEMFKGESEFLSILAAAVGVGDSATGDAEGLVYRRNPDILGPMSVFGYSYFSDHLSAERINDLALPRYRGLWGSGGEYGYEALNLVDGERTISEVRDALAAQFGPVPLAHVADYLAALAEINVICESARGCN